MANKETSDIEDLAYHRIPYTQGQSWPLNMSNGSVHILKDDPSHDDCFTTRIIVDFPDLDRHRTKERIAENRTEGTKTGALRGPRIA